MKQVKLNNIPKHPQSKDMFQALHVFFDDNNEKQCITSNQEFETVSECKSWIDKNSSVLDYGEVDWKVMMIERSIII